MGQDIVALHLYKILVLLDFDENNKYLNIKDMQQNTHKKTPHRCTNFFLLGAIKSGGNDKLWYGEPKKTSEYWRMSWTRWEGKKPSVTGKKINLANINNSLGLEWRWTWGRGPQKVREQERARHVTCPVRVRNVSWRQQRAIRRLKFFKWLDLCFRERILAAGIN